MENGAWTDGLNFAYEMCLSIVVSRAENLAVYPFDYVLCKRLSGLFGAFVVKVMDCGVGSFRGLFGRIMVLGMCF